MPVNFFFLNIRFKVYICICNILVAEGLLFSRINNPLHYITLHYITLHYITLHYITLHYITLHYITLHYIDSIMNNTSNSIMSLNEVMNSDAGNLVGRSETYFSQGCFATE